MFFNILLGLMLLDGLLLSVVVLMQAGQGGGLASLGGSTTSQVLGGRTATTVLTKATWITGGVFMSLALILSTMSGAHRNSASAVQESLRQSATQAPVQAAPAQTGSGVGDLLNKPTTTDTGAAKATPGAAGAATPPATTPPVKKP